MGATEGRVGVRELRENLSVYLRRVAAGQVFEVTEHGHPVALLAPLRARMGVRERLIADGRLIPAKGDLLSFGPPLDVPLRMSSKEALDLEREERLP